MNETLQFSTKKLSQTRLSSYFTNCAKLAPPETKSSRKSSAFRSRKRLSFSSSASSEASKSLDSEHCSLTNISVIPKRRLPAPIFSDDEDSENEPVPSPKRRLDNNGQTKLVPVKQSPNSSPEKTPTNNNRKDSPDANSKNRLSLLKSSPGKSSAVDNSCNNNTRETPDANSKKIRVLQNIVVDSPKKSPLKEPKDETKKVNYEQVHLMQEFFQNVQENNQLLDLLDNTDVEFLSKFFKMEKEYQFICVKLFLWKPMWYNIYNFVQKLELTLSAAEVTTMYEFLKSNGFVKTDYVMDDLVALLHNLSLTGIRDLARRFRLPKLGNKDSIIARLLKNCKVQSTLSTKMNLEGVLRKRIEEIMGFCVQLSDQLSKCLHLLYVLNTFSNSTLIDPHDYLKSVTYFNMVFPVCEIENTSIFTSPAAFSRFSEAIKLRCELQKAVERRNQKVIFDICKYAFDTLRQQNQEFGDSFDFLQPQHLERFTSNAQYALILSKASRHITSTYFDHVMGWYEYLISQGYCKYKRGDWYAFLIHIYTWYIKNYEKAAKLLIHALKNEKDNFSDIQLQELAHRGKILNRKSYKLATLFRDEIASLTPALCDRDWPQDVLECKSIKSDDPGRKRMYVHRHHNGDVNYLTVEDTALQYYQTVGFPHGSHCEGALINAAFCLLFWDIIYDSKVEATFVSNVQNAPLDMYTDCFFKNREHAITQRLHNIKQKWTDDVIKKLLVKNWCYHSHETTLCLIESAIEGPEELFTVVMCIGRHILGGIFERLVKNYKLYHSGFPDLIVWNPEEKKAKFVEVKSENDKLSLKQKLWLNYLIDIGASVAVCHVESKASKKKFKVKTRSES